MTDPQSSRVQDAEPLHASLAACMKGVIASALATIRTFHGSCPTIPTKAARQFATKRNRDDS